MNYLTRDIYIKEIDNLITKIKEDYITNNINDKTHNNIEECYEIIESYEILYYDDHDIIIKYKKELNNLFNDTLNNNIKNSPIEDNKVSKMIKWWNSLFR